MVCLLASFESNKECKICNRKLLTHSVCVHATELLIDDAV
jgi:hypothetical protein